MQAQTILQAPPQGASAGNAPARGTGGTDGGGEQFSQALTREMAQRQPQPAQGASAAAARPQSGDAHPAQAAAAAGARPQADGSEAGATSESIPGDSAPVDSAAEAAGAADAIAMIAPVTDMLALAAALNPAAVTTTAATAAAASTVLAGAAAVNDMVGVAGSSRTDASTTATATTAANAAGTATTTAAAAGAAIASLATDAAPGTNVDSAGVVSGQARVSTASQLQQSAHTAGAALSGQPQQAAAGAADARPTFADFAAQAVQQRQGAREDGPAIVASEKTAEAAVPAPLPSAPQALQAARTDMPAAAAGQLPARVGTPAWDNQVGHKIVWMAGAGEQTASLTLNPPDLGPMQIVLAVTDDKASVAFTSAQPEVRQALEAAMPRLREMLGETGISLGEATVSAGTPGDRSHDGRPGGARGGMPAGDGPAPAAATVVQRRALPGLVDTFA